MFYRSRLDKLGYHRSVGRPHRQRLPGFKYSEKLRATTDLEEALTDTDAILFVVPTKVTRLVAKQVKTCLGLA